MHVCTLSWYAYAPTMINATKLFLHHWHRRSASVAHRAMGFDEAMLALRSTPTQAVEQLLGTIAKLNLQDSRRYLNVDGTPSAF